jgi:GAF domain-containing protein
VTEEPRTRPWEDEKPSREALIAALAKREGELAARERELAEARGREAATAAVINVISRSKVDLDAVLTTLTEAARTLCGAAYAAVYMRDGALMRLRAQAGLTPEFIAYLADHPIDPATKRGERTHVGRAALRGKIVEIEDAPASAEFRLGDAPALGNFRAALGVPLLRDGRVEGVFGLARPEPGRFPPEQIELVKAFAGQAVIAIENARLFNETKEALERQTATSEILKVIAASPSDTAPVFEVIAQSANRLLGGFSTTVWRLEGEIGHLAAFTPTNPEADAALRALSPRPIDEFAVAPLREGEIVQIPETEEAPQPLREIARLRGYRAMLFVPLLQRGSAVGFVGVTRKEPGPFDSKDMALLKTFADQAVIAIENARLFDEVQAKTRDLEESLHQQTATADVLKVISRSAFDLQSVLHTLVESAAKLCDADGALITREVDGVLYRAESYGCSDQFMAAIRRIPIVPERGSVSGRVLLEGKAIQIEDIEADPEYTFKAYAKMEEFRTCLGIPMLRNGAPVGVISLLRTEVRPFNDKQIELVQTFADQAVIAIENARLFDEVQAKTRDLEEALQQQSNRQRAQSYQPLSLRLGCGPQNADRLRAAAQRCGDRHCLRARGRGSADSRRIGVQPRLF